MVGLDIEQNGRDSYEGFCCLLQFATYGDEQKTFVIDVLSDEVKDTLKRTLGKYVLENPKIVKIIHGGISSDVVWLQRDFGILITNVFDTQEF